MEKIAVRVCTGTACYVMGASDILIHVEDLIARGRSVALEGSPCLGMCKLGETKRPPYVYVGETLIERATVERVTEAIERMEGQEKQEQEEKDAY